MTVRRAFHSAPTWIVVMAALLFAVVPRLAFAAEVRASVDRDTVGVGDTIRYTVEASSTDEAPRNAQPGPIPGFAVRGSNMAPSTMVTIVNGAVTRRQGLTATWILEATRQGKLMLGPAVVTIGNTRVTANPVTVTVGPPGSGAPPAPPGLPGFSPFDPWKGLFRNPFDDHDDDPQQPQGIDGIQFDPNLALDAPRGRGAFLHAVLDKTAAVVGEQVTLSIYVYVDPTEPGSTEFTDIHEATASDFVKQAIIQDESTSKVTGIANVGGRPWKAQLVRRWALFPLKAGDAEVGPMTLTLGKAFRGQNRRRQSETLRVRVTEPPMAGRPPGYVVGDVGRFALSAEVTPREIEQDGAVAVTVELSGTGNLPSKLPVPSRAGVEWLEPTVKEKLGAEGDRFGGTRTFTYVVRVHKPGDVDLGEIVLPTWDPDAKKYEVVRADLGTVTVKPGGGRPAASSEPVDPFAGLPKPRGALLGDGPGKKGHLADSPLFWLGLLGSPLAWAAAFGARSARRKLRERAASRGVSPAAELKERIRAAEGACRGDDPRAADAAIARVLECAASVHAGVSMRGIPGDQLVPQLVDAGVNADTARELRALHAACESARFSPEGADIASARSRWNEAKTVLERLRGGA